MRDGVVSALGLGRVLRDQRERDPHNHLSGSIPHADDENALVAVGEFVLSHVWQGRLGHKSGCLDAL